MQTVRTEKIKEFAEDKLLKKVPLETDKIVFNTFFLKPKQILPFHKHPATDELFYIVEGAGEFTVGNEQSPVGPSSAVYGPAGVFHGIVNSGDKDMAMISVQGPKPVETIFKENASIICPVCKQEVILKDDAKDGDKIICPRCQAKLTLKKEGAKFVAVH